jgi:hypothetical protein
MSEGPQMKQMGNIAVAPTWSENLAGAAQKMIGGLQTRRARQDQTALGSDREETAQAKGLQKAMEAKQVQDQLMVENDAKLRAEQLAQTKVDNQVDQFGQTLEADKAAEGVRVAELAAATKRENDYRKSLAEAKVDAATALAASKVALAGGEDGKGKPPTAQQAKALYNAENMDKAIGEAWKVLEDDYNPGGVQGFWDQLMTGSMYTNILASEPGQIFNSSMGTIREAALRTSTGAAAPETEQADYMMTLIPRAGDSRGVVAWKMKKIAGIQKNIASLGGEDISEEEADRNFNSAVDEQREEIPTNEEMEAVTESAEEEPQYEYRTNPETGKKQRKRIN